MTQVFDDKGNVRPVTVLEAGPIVITQIKTTVRIITYDIDKHKTRKRKNKQNDIFHFGF